MRPGNATSRSISTIRSLLAQNGWAPSEGNPQFHQQMVYAVAMRTVEHFERALGRPVLWRPQPNPSECGRRFAVPAATDHPAACAAAGQRVLQSRSGRAAVRLLRRGRVDAGRSRCPAAASTPVCRTTSSRTKPRTPSSTGCTGASTSRAIPTCWRFHEAFADIVALLQHFTIPEILVGEISRTRGDLESESMLGSLAIQFGQASGGRGALRQAIGRFDENGVWRRNAPDPTALQRQLEPHARGSVLVAAVFDAFLAVLQRTDRRPAPHCDRRHRGADRPARSIPIWFAAWPRRPAPWRARCSTCASGRSTTCRPSTSRSSSICGP